jgi:hypothetical protein
MYGIESERRGERPQASGARLRVPSRYLLGGQGYRTSMQNVQRRSCVCGQNRCRANTLYAQREQYL